MKLIITEKPSVAKEIAHALGANKSENGYLTDQKKYIVTWAFGHLLQVKETKEKWNLDQLPLLPTYEYEPILSGVKQLKVIETLYKSADEIVIATDAGREGELIARLILNYVSNSNTWIEQKKCWRVFTSEALTEEVVTRIFNNLESADKYSYLYYNALARQWADWVQGINLTRFVSLKANTLYSVGRVQTPVLRLIVQNTLEKNNFKIEKFKVLGYKGKKNEYDYIFESDHNLVNIPDINNFNKDQVKIEDKKAEIKTIAKPHLHDITSLQIEANERFAISPTKTLELTQRLYEEYKVVSYPRTDSNYLPESAREVLKTCLKNTGFPEKASLVDNLGYEVFDNSKLTDHHALLCLKKLVTDDEQLIKIYNLILLRMLSQFELPAKKELVAYSFKHQNHLFTYRCSRYIERGFKKLYEQVNDTDDDQNITNLEFEIGEILNGKFMVLDKQTQPPKLYTEGNLIKKMKALNLGTAATRDGILKKLQERDYVTRSGKSLSATEKGMQLIEKVKNYEISTVEYTEKIENDISTVKSKNELVKFLGGIIEFTKTFINDNKDITFNRLVSEKQKDVVKRMAAEKGVKVDISKLTSENIDEIINDIKNVEIRCICGNAIRNQKFSYTCTCGLSIPKEFLGKKITGDMVKKLLEGKSVDIKGLISKSKNKFDAKIKIEAGRIAFVKN